MTRIPIKALSVNALYRGRRFSTAAYDKYRQDLSLVLPPIDIPPGNLTVVIRYGVSSKRADLDNLAKGFLDALQARYDFNDCRVYMLVMEKEDVARGSEYIEFEILPRTDRMAPPRDELVAPRRVA